MCPASVAPLIQAKLLAVSDQVCSCSSVKLKSIIFTGLKIEPIMIMSLVVKSLLTMIFMRLIQYDEIHESINSRLLSLKRSLPHHQEVPPTPPWILVLKKSFINI